MEHDVVVTLDDGSVRRFRIYGRPKPRVGEVVTLPLNGKLVKFQIDAVNGTELIGSFHHIEAFETEVG